MSVSGDSPQPVDDGLFAMPDAASSTSTTFEGRLALRGTLFDGQELAFVQSGRDLIPVRRGLIEEPFTAWDTTWVYFLEPGHVWLGGRGHALASLPVTLTPQGGNCAFQGVLAFTFYGEAVSDVWAQFTAETCRDYPIDAAVWLRASYRPGGIGDADSVRAAFAEERARRFPTRPLAQLAEDYPGADLSAFGRNVADPSVYGVVLGGVNYRSECPTRHGFYAYCDAMRFSSFSTAKSAFVGVAFLRLAQKYGPEVGDQLLYDYLPELREDPGAFPGWETTTIENVVDLASGHFGPEDPYLDCLRDGCSATALSRATLSVPAAAPPGTRFLYRTGEMFLAVRAMQEFLRSREGPDADLFEFVVDEVYRPLGIGPGFFSSLRTPDVERQAYGGSGMWWSVDDAAKLATLLLGGGRLEGEPILQPALLRDSLFQNPADRGLPRLDPPDAYYNNAFWGEHWTSADGFACDVWTATMSGANGIIITLLPGGAAYYYFSDGGTFDLRDGLREAERLSGYASCAAP